MVVVSQVAGFCAAAGAMPMGKEPSLLRYSGRSPFLAKTIQAQDGPEYTEQGRSVQHAVAERNAVVRIGFSEESEVGPEGKFNN